MGLGDKLRSALGGKSSKDDELDTTTGTTGSGTTGTHGHHGTHGTHGSHGGSTAAGTTGTTGTGTTGSGTTGTGGSTVQRAEQKAASAMPGHHSGTGSGMTGQNTGSSTGYTGQGSNTGTGSGSNTGYSTGGNTGSGMTGQNTGSSTGGTRSYQVGNQGDIDNRRGDMSNIVGSTPNIPQGKGATQDLNLQSNYDKEHWREAMEKTELAEHEVATATMHADKANNALGKAQQAQGVMGQHASEHDRLLAEAERQRGLVQDPSNLRGGLNSAQLELREAEEAAARHNRALKDADSAFAAKQKELDGLTPALRNQDQKMHGLASEYDNAMAKRDAVAADAERLRNQAAEAERARGGISSTVEQLMEKLRLAEEEMVTRERAFLQARDNHRGLHDQLRRARGELDGVNAQYEKNAGAANVALESAQGWDDKTARLRAQLQEHEQEHNRLLELIQRLKAELEAKLAELEGLRRHGQPNKQAIEQAELSVNNQRNSLREAEARAKDAEARYRQLVKDADSHKARAAEAAKAAKNYGGQYQGNLKEAELHGDKHAELWSEAKSAGGMGSDNATSAFQKLKEKVQEFRNEP